MSLEKVAETYLPPRPHKSAATVWLQLVSIILAFVLVVGILAVLVRAHEVDNSKHERIHALAENKLYGILEGERPVDESPIGRLAGKLENLMRSRERPLNTLKRYWVNTYELETARKQLGWDFFSRTYPSSECETDCYTNLEGYFKDEFVFKVYAARFETNPAIYKNGGKVPKVIGSGILQGKWLALTLIVLLLLDFIGWGVLAGVAEERRSAEIKRFIQGLAHPQREVLELVGEFEKLPSRAYLSHLRDQARELEDRLRGDIFSKRDDLLNRAKTLFTAMQETPTATDANELPALKGELKQFSKQEREALGTDDKESGSQDKDS